MYFELLRDIMFCTILDGAAFRQNEIIDIINASPSAQHSRDLKKAGDQTYKGEES